ncbi:ABC transporter permease [Georgenia alba]|uniref:ABC transporter permease n=1 Tax=Georgenia alba TaxID=2233858 RepID=A0ABW2Q1W1_9MICO
MARYLLGKLWQSAVTLVLASVVIFVGVRSLPGDPALAMAGEEADPETLARVRADLGLDQPVLVQYVRFVGSVLRGDLGESIRTGIPVTDLVSQTLPVTLWLAGYAIVVAVVLGIGLGVLAAVYRGRWPDYLTGAVAVLGLSVPSFWIGILAILYLAVELGWFPASGYTDVLQNPARGLYHLTMPAFILATSTLALLLRQTRASMIETLGADFIRTARAKGMAWPRIVTRYALRNSVIVVVTLVGLQLGGLVSGAVVTEQIFALPGIGKLTLDSVFTRDYPVIQAVVLVVTLFYIVINLLTDVLYTVIDPRIRIGGRTR